LLTANTFLPVSTDVVFGINTNNSTDFGDYQIIEPNRLFTTSQGQFGDNLRIGAKLLSPGIVQLGATNNPGDPYDSSSYVCSIMFDYENSGTSATMNFRIRFYNDPFRTQLIHTFYTGNDQTGWSIGSGDNIFPGGGLSFNVGETKTITFTPGILVSSNQRWYVTIDAYDGSSFETLIDDKSYICASCHITNESGVVAEYYRMGLPSNMYEIPDFGQYTPDYVCVEPVIDFSLQESSSTWVSENLGALDNYYGNFAARLRGRVQCPLSGDYTFVLTSDDGSRLFIDGLEIITMNQLQPWTSTAAIIELTEGYHDIEVHYFQGGGDHGLNLSWIIPGESTATTVSSSRLFHAVTSEYCEDLDTPRILNFAVLFELENGESIKVNLGE